MMIKHFLDNFNDYSRSTPFPGQVINPGGNENTPIVHTIGIPVIEAYGLFAFDFHPDFIV